MEICIWLGSVNGKSKGHLRKRRTRRKKEGPGETKRDQKEPGGTRRDQEGPSWNKRYQEGPPSPVGKRGGIRRDQDEPVVPRDPRRSVLV